MTTQQSQSALVWLALCSQIMTAHASCSLAPGATSFFASSCQGRDAAFQCCGFDCRDNDRGCGSFCCWKSDGMPANDPGDNNNDMPDVDMAGIGQTMIFVVFALVMGCCFCFACCVVPTSVFCVIKKIRKEQLLGDDSDADSDSDTDLPDDAAPPVYWNNQDLFKKDGFDERYEQEDLIPIAQQMLDDTWKDVVTRDRKGGAPSRLEVVSVQRFEDSEMWAAYLQHKEKLKQRGRMTSVLELDGDKTQGHVKTDVYARQLAHGVQLDRNLNEHYLFHGTSPQAAENIAEDGFRINLAGSNAGTMFGKGAYFAECSSKADEYAVSGAGAGPLGIRGFAQEDDEYAILLCRVCCGKMFRALRASDKDKFIPQVEKKQIDSVLGDREASVGTYREFVVFKESQIYPEYRILYRRIYDDDGAE